MLVLSQLASREGFNNLSRHIRRVIEVIDKLGNNSSLLSDQLAKLSTKLPTNDFLSAISVLVEKYNYQYISFNLGLDFLSIEEINKIRLRIKNVDCFFVYHDPNEGVTVLTSDFNRELKKNRLLVIYASSNDLTVNVNDLLEKIKLVIKKKKANNPEIFKKYSVPPITTNLNRKLGHELSKNNLDKIKNKTKKIEPVKIEENVESVKKISPTYIVQVTNELFHNGNVEAWKNIIESYNYKNPNSKVYVYHKGERIVNLNSLFKWGKVRHGEPIQFKVKGEFKDLAKLKRYLYEGASNRFEQFLRKELNSYLKLF